jgi:hypothetical protein
MIMSAQLRKLMLTVHVASSVGWLGAAAAYGALVLAALGSSRGPLVRAAYLALEPMTWLAIVPLAMGSLLTGLVQSLGTSWGLVRHYWVVYKLVLTMFAATILLMNTRTVGALSRAAAAAQEVDLDGLKGQLLHCTLGILVLLVTTILGTYKPPGLTRYGWRKKYGESFTPRVSPPRLPSETRSD